MPDKNIEYHSEMKHYTIVAIGLTCMVLSTSSLLAQTPEENGKKLIAIFDKGVAPDLLGERWFEIFVGQKKIGYRRVLTTVKPALPKEPAYCTRIEEKLETERGRSIEIQELVFDLKLRPLSFCGSLDSKVCGFPRVRETYDFKVVKKGSTSLVYKINRGISDRKMVAEISAEALVPPEYFLPLLPKMCGKHVLLNVVYIGPKCLRLNPVLHIFIHKKSEYDISGQKRVAYKAVLDCRKTTFITEKGEVLEISSDIFSYKFCPKESDAKAGLTLFNPEAKPGWASNRTPRRLLARFSYSLLKRDWVVCEGCFDFEKVVRNLDKERYDKLDEKERRIFLAKYKAAMLNGFKEYVEKRRNEIDVRELIYFEYKIEVNQWVKNVAILTMPRIPGMRFKAAKVKDKGWLIVALK
jgi:hypothetical protein